MPSNKKTTPQDEADEAPAAPAKATGPNLVTVKATGPARVTVETIGDRERIPNGSFELRDGEEQHFLVSAGQSIRVDAA